MCVPDTHLMLDRLNDSRTGGLYNTAYTLLISSSSIAHVSLKTDPSSPSHITGQSEVQSSKMTFVTAIMSLGWGAIYSFHV